jgi:hypothetical protein
MKRNNVDAFEKRKAFVLILCAQTIDSVNGRDPRNRFAMRVVWLILGIACVALGWELLTILLR